MIKNIQYLRFLAAFLVILAHANLQLYGVSAQITNLGGFGVDIFFIISGFIMPFVLYGGMYEQNSQLKMGSGTFLLRRIFRIWPMYLIIILVVMLLSYLVANGIIANPSADLAYIFNGSKLEFKWFLETVTFSHWSRPPLLNIGWTLQFEFIFYAAIALVVFLGLKKFEALEIALLGFFFLFAMIGYSAATVSGVVRTLGSPIIFEFIFGMLLYRLVSSQVLISKYVALIIVAVTIPVFLFVELNIQFRMDAPFHRLFISGPAAFLLVWSALSLEKLTKENWFFELLGDASYSLYLVHGVVAPLFAFIWTSYGLDQNVSVLIYISAYILACHAVAIFAHLKIEKPINRFLRNLTQREQKCALVSP